jgi:phage terminase small subunit
MATKLTKKQKGFVKDYLETGNGVESALRNYDTTDYNTANVIAVENLQKPTIIEYLNSKADDAVSMIYTLSQKGEQESIRLSASKDILDRAGYKAIDRTQNVNVNIETTLTNQEQEALRVEYEAKLHDSLLK